MSKIPKLSQLPTYITNTYTITDPTSSYDLIDNMKQQVKNKLIKELNPVKWFRLEEDTVIMVGVQTENGNFETCQTSLYDLKRHLFNELLEELENRGAFTPRAPLAPPVSDD